jgi:DNA replication protein DnaC
VNVDYLNGVIKNALANADRSGTVLGEDGLLHCSVCGAPRELRVEGVKEPLPVMCLCEAEQYEREQAEKRLRNAVYEAKLELERLGPLYDPGYDRCTFSKDKWPESRASVKARSYAAHFDELRDKGQGMIFSGPVGTGKSFLAACIVNELRRKGKRCLILSTARLITVLRELRDTQRQLDALASLDLLALDDLGAERATDYALELLESLVDTRALRDRPLLVTTNLTARELREPQDLRYTRLFDRLSRLSPAIVALQGPSLRAQDRPACAAEIRAVLEAG